MIFPSDSETFLRRLEAKPSGNLTDLIKRQNFFQLISDKGYSACGFRVLFPTCFSQSSHRMPKFHKSCLAFVVSFDFPSMPIIVSSILSYTFFSTCITSRLCLSCNEDQYSSSKNMLFFAQFSSSSFRFRFFPHRLCAFQVICI